MTALPYQPVPTIAQRRAFAADHAKRYAEIQALRRAESAARDACCDTTPEPDPVEKISEDFVIAALGVSVLCLLAIAFTWGIPA